MRMLSSISRATWRAACVGLVGLLSGCGTAEGAIPTSGDTTLKTAIVACPLITGLRIQPLTTSVGNSIDLAALASADGSALSFAWSASEGAFSDATARETSYQCTHGGDQKILLVVSDGQCGDLAEAPVSCVPDR
jgi:hypothetical protein